MKSSESVQGYLSRVSESVNLMKACGDKITDETIVSTVFRCLNKRFDHAIEDSRDLCNYGFDELIDDFIASS